MSAIRLTEDEREDLHDALCQCRGSGTGFVFRQADMDKIAPAIEALLAARLVEQAERTLTEAADDWRNEGRGVMFNKAGDDLTPERRVGKWLRDRAARIGAAS